MFVLLIGPKGSGKSHIGRRLEKHLGVEFFHVEPLWLRYFAECEAAGRSPVIAEGASRINPLIAKALQRHDHVCVETTGASPEILNALLSWTEPSDRLVARISAPLELCLERVASRDQANQIPMSQESVRKVHELSMSAEFHPDLALENVDLTDSEIVSAFRSSLATR